MKIDNEKFAKIIIDKMKKENLIAEDIPEHQLVTMTYTALHHLISNTIKKYNELEGYEINETLPN